MSHWSQREDASTRTLSHGPHGPGGMMAFYHYSRSPSPLLRASPRACTPCVELETSDLTMGLPSTCSSATPPWRTGKWLSARAGQPHSPQAADQRVHSGLLFLFLFFPPEQCWYAFINNGNKWVVLSWSTPMTQARMSHNNVNKKGMMGHWKAGVVQEAFWL